MSFNYDSSLSLSGKIDAATGLYYFNARWYDAGTGRFITEDPARDGSNWYIYVYNNPINFTDPTGLQGNPYGNSGWWNRKRGSDSQGEETTESDPETENPPPSNPPPYNPPGYNPSGPGNDPGNEPQENTPSMVVSHSENSSDHRSSRMQNSWIEDTYYAQPSEMPKDWVLNKVKESGYLGKHYSSDNVCSDFLINMLYLLGADWSRYFPLGRNSSVVENMKFLNNRGILSSTPYPGWNVFYKQYTEKFPNGNFKGHVGFVYIVNNIQIIIHNGWAGDSVSPQVTIIDRTGNRKFPSFFRSDPLFDPKYLPVRRRF